MSERGFDFGVDGVQVEWIRMARRRTSPARLHFPSIATARGFFYQYKDFEWENEDATQTIIVRLQNILFDAELLNPSTRAQATQASNITASMLASVTLGLST